MKKDTVLVVGSVAIDDVETPFGKRVGAVGGSAIYFSMACSFFTKVCVVGIAGTDFPRDTIHALNERNVDTKGLIIQEGKTFRWGGKYHDNINFRDTLYTELGLFEKFDPKLPEEYRTVPFVFLANIQPSLQLKVLNEVASPRFVACDTMNLWIDTAHDELLKLLGRVNMLLINDFELYDLTGEYNLIKGLEKVHDLGPEYVVIKKGENGAYLSSKGRLFFSPAYPVRKPIDPTGAGDSFAGGLFGFLATTGKINFRTLKKALIYGSVFGSICVEDFSINNLLKADHNLVEKRYRFLRNLVSLL
ncbi:MAG: sugar kinase [Candidatus Marinimicrobia bacterium]|nr:sugar kinase [Candidatus Neomarinimicrobiota bacterium]